MVNARVVQVSATAANVAAAAAAEEEELVLPPLPAQSGPGTKPFYNGAGVLPTTQYAACD